MPIYQYKAFAAGGAVQTGVVDADTERDARNKLRRNKLLVSDLKEMRGRGRVSRNSEKQTNVLARLMQARAANTGPGARETEIIGGVTRQLATLLASGIPLVQSFDAIVEQAEQRRLETLFREIRERIQQGASMADALEEHPGWFTELYVNMVRAGQAAGNLDTVLSRLADYMQTQRVLRRKILGAMMYPAMMISIGMIVVAILMTKVVPEITTMLIDQDKALPASTKVLVDISYYFQNYWWLGLLVVGFTSAIIERIHKKSPAGQLFLDRSLLRIPVLGDLLRRASVARFTRTLATLLQSGVPVIQGLEITEKVVGNRVVADATKHIRERVIEGTDIATPLKQSGAFPAVVGYMVAVGEQAGELEQMLDRIALTYDEEIDTVTERLTALLEPIMIVCLASVVGFIVYAIVQPILEMGQL
ncbi:MAG: general secretion pathway protein F [Planctomycetota bacterium]|jgi:general secretion pathway protein F